MILYFKIADLQLLGMACAICGRPGHSQRTCSLNLFRVDSPKLLCLQGTVCSKEIPRNPPKFWELRNDTIFKSSTVPLLSDISSQEENNIYVPPGDRFFDSTTDLVASGKLRLRDPLLAKPSLYLEFEKAGTFTSIRRKGLISRYRWNLPGFPITPNVPAQIDSESVRRKRDLSESSNSKIESFSN